MANELNIQLNPFKDSGLTLVAKAFNPDGTQLGSDVAMTEVGSRAYYTANFSLAAVSDGAYLISFETTNKFYGSGILYVKDNTEINVNDLETETLASGRETNIISEIDANETKIDLIETKAQADSRQAILVGEHNDTQADIAALNDFNPATDTVANVTLVATTTTNTDMRGTDGANTIAPDNAGITQIQTDISNLNDITAAEVYTEFTNGTNEDAFKADVSALATQSSVDTIDANVDAILVDTSTTIPAQISALNDISPAEVNAEVDTALNDYDAPTKAELDATETAILAAISALNDLDQQEVAEAVWDYLQSNTTVSASMKEAIEKILINANLIPATV